jgi:translation initiation factor 2B subunit (eIF-2B alpha/beta/delta family)/8-oxo-dGTP pyrophosphatase MutT (NUDIX family)
MRTTTAASSSASQKIRRVVSTFLLSGGATRGTVRIAVFHRADTMPTFASHWAACSGSVEPGDGAPLRTAQREILEETNLQPEHVVGEVCGRGRTATRTKLTGGLHVDVPFRKKKEGEFEERIIRVYPFWLRLPDDWDLQLAGTEHDGYDTVSVEELEQLAPAVPALATAFHHATAGLYLADDAAPRMGDIREWAANRVDGAAAMAVKAAELVAAADEDDGDGADKVASALKMMRPSMVAIANALDSLLERKQTPAEVLEALKRAASEAVDYSVERILELTNGKRTFRVATHSRSSTVAKVLRRVAEECRVWGIECDVICSKSAPGDEGILMAEDLKEGSASKVECVEDAELLDMLAKGELDLLVTGCDCLTATDVVNKVGTGDMARAAAQKGNTKVFCCADRWKRWSDIFPPPLEDIFECVPIELFDEILIPPSQRAEIEDESRL